jgi:predicted transcriptional regulator of viral defense system
MRFEQLVDMVGEVPVFEASNLMTRVDRPNTLRHQLDVWKEQGKLKLLRPGLYVLARQYRQTRPHPFLVANHLVPGSYVSCESALMHYGLISERRGPTVSVNSIGSGEVGTVLGRYVFHQIDLRYIAGYEYQALTYNQSAMVARPEKALLDFIYLTPEENLETILESLRLQNLRRFEVGASRAMAEVFDNPKLWEAVERLVGMMG